MPNEMIALSRDCEAVQIPSGNKIQLSRGLKVMITQSLGGTFTVMTEDGYMVRIQSKDADAIGQTPAESNAVTPTDEKDIGKLVWEQLKTCYDPEIPIDIVELGLVYDCQITVLSEGEHKVDIKMTLTAPGCGMGDVLSKDVQTKLLSVPGVKEANVQLVWDPPWNMERMSDAAKLHLGML